MCPRPRVGETRPHWQVQNGPQAAFESLLLGPESRSKCKFCRGWIVHVLRPALWLAISSGPAALCSFHAIMEDQWAGELCREGVQLGSSTVPTSGYPAAGILLGDPRAGRKGTHDRKLLQGRRPSKGISGSGKVITHAPSREPPLSLTFSLTLSVKQRTLY